jgi:transposase
MAATQSAIAVIGIDIGKNSFHIVGLDGRGAIVLTRSFSDVGSMSGLPKADTGP